MSGSEETSQELKVKSLQGLLKWSATQEGTSPKGDGPVVLDKERQAFLATVLKQLAAGAVEEIHQVFAVVSAPGESEKELEGKVNALNHLHELIEDIDNASDFMKIGGAGICYAAVKSTHEPLQYAALGCLAAAAQNNPQVQADLHKSDLIDRLNVILAGPAASPGAAAGVHTRAVHALSCEIRGQPELVQAWSDGEGPAILAKLIASIKAPSSRFMVKVANMLSFLPVDYPGIRTVAVDSGLLAALLTFVTPDEVDDAVWEHTTRALVRLVQDCAPAATLLSEHRIADTIRRRQTEVARRPEEDQEGLAEEKAYAAALLALLPP